jgi:hypothetical protein
MTRERVGIVSLEENVHTAVASANRHGNSVPIVGDFEIRQLMFAGEDAPAGKVIEQRARIAAWNVNAFVCLVRANLLEANETNSGNGVAGVNLRAEWRRQRSLHDVRVHPEVHQDSPSNQSLDDRQAHETISTAEPPTISTGAGGGRPAVRAVTPESLLPRARARR